MTRVLQECYLSGELTYISAKHGEAGFLARTAGPCAFCVNDHWKFPLGCRYGKPDEPALPAGLLDKAATAIMKAGIKIHPEVVVQRMIDDGFETDRGLQYHS
jgi:hypothetical protein